MINAITENKYNMELMEALNKDWETHPFHKNIPIYTHEAQIETGEMRLRKLEKIVELDGKKILEIGGGLGYTSYAIARHTSAEVICIDIRKHPEWERMKLKNLRFENIDLSAENPFRENEFDLIISFVAWEHMRHPFEMLQQAAFVLKVGGAFYLHANLYRGPSASHLYRVIFFPWPHLLFEKKLMIEYAKKKGVSDEFIAWFCDVNKLTLSEYKEYFEKLNLNIVKEERSKFPIDWEFYFRFYDQLSLYPIYDLETDFFSVFLEKTANVEIKSRILISKPSIGSGDTVPIYIGEPIMVNARIYTAHCELAWYVILDGVVIERWWYTQPPKIIFYPEKAGTYIFRCFARKNKMVEYMDSDKIVVEV